MPNILKRFMDAVTYVFPDADSLTVDEVVPEPTASGGTPLATSGSAELPPEPEPAPSEEEPEQKAEETLEAEEAPEEEEVPEPASPRRKSSLDFAKIQADALMAQARREAEELKEQTLANAQKELEQLRKKARQEGYQAGYAEGMASGKAEAKAQLADMAKEQAKSVKDFLEAAAKEKQKILDNSEDDLKDLAMAVAEKVIRVSLKSSNDILLRMIESATDKHKRCVWVHIYIADCDTKEMALTIPELVDALRHLSDRVRVIPMADDESGTCIIETPDEIIDASVSTQLSSIRDILFNMGPN